MSHDDELNGLVNLASYLPRENRAVPEDGTAAGELLGVVKYKYRPVVVLSEAKTPVHHGSFTGGESCLVAPLHTARRDDTNEYKLNPSVVWEAIRYERDWLFYLPDDPTFRMKEGIVRLDYMSTIHHSCMSEQYSASLTEEAMALLNGWVRNFVHGALGHAMKADLEAYRELLDENPSMRDSLGL